MEYSEAVDVAEGWRRTAANVENVAADWPRGSVEQDAAAIVVRRLRRDAKDLLASYPEEAL